MNPGGREGAAPCPQHIVSADQAWAGQLSRYLDQDVCAHVQVLRPK